MAIKYPQVRVHLVGEDGNAWSIMSRVASAMRRAGVPADEVSAYIKQSTSGDYDNLLRTAMEWVNCDGAGDTNTTKRYRKSTPALDRYWEDVKFAVRDARLIAFDGCHKIYLAMDDEQADWFREHYNGEYGDTTFTGTPEEMLARLHDWYDESCGLKFIQSVTTDHDDPNGGWERLIPQGAEDEDCCDSCGESMKQPYADGLCEMCWEDDEEDEDESDWDDED